MPVQIQVIHGAHKGQTFSIDTEGAVYVVSRKKKARKPGIWLTKDRTVSQHHAEIVLEGGNLRIREVKSINGVWLGHQKLTASEWAHWKPSLTVTIGDTELAYDDVRCNRFSAP